MVYNVVYDVTCHAIGNTIDFITADITVARIEYLSPMYLCLPACLSASLPPFSVSLRVEYYNVSTNELLDD